jgi:cytosine/adenosine deaminase-related metal-dependent hydrolase
MAEVASPTNRTLVKGGWIVAFDGGEHRILQDGVLVYEGDSIFHVGKRYDGPVDKVIDASYDLVIPGLINTHVHVGSQAGDRMILDGGRRDLFRSGFLNHWPAKGVGGPNLFAFEDQRASIRYSLASLLRFGSTTVVEMGGEFGDDPGGLARMAAELGLRLYTTPGFSSANHYYDQGGRLQRHWDEKAGEAALDRAIAFATEHGGSHGDLIRAILVPYEFYLCTPALLRRTKRAATQLGIGITLHVAESVIEFHDTLRETGKTPIGLLREIGFLGPEVILGHCLYTGSHSQTAYPFDVDVRAVAESGASVAHCPLVFGRRGLTLETFQRYLDEGVNISIGTDTYPQDILEELRIASILGKVADRDFEAAKARDVFNAATLGGARALCRDDLGRIAPGAKADLVIVDFARLRVGPFLDPIKALVQCGVGELVKHVIVAGRTVVENGVLPGCDEAKMLADVRASTSAAWRHFGDYHHGPEPIDQAYPPAFAPWIERASCTGRNC